MPTNIKDYSTTQASNTSLNGISTAEGMLPSNLNNALRALMKNTRDGITKQNGLSMVMVQVLTLHLTHQLHHLQLQVQT